MEKITFSFLFIVILHFFIECLKHFKYSILRKESIFNKEKFSLKTIEGASGTKYQLNLSNSWQVVKNLDGYDPCLEFFIENDKHDEYIDCFTENSSDFTDLEEFASWVESKLKDEYSVETEFREVAGNEGRVMFAEYTGTFGGVIINNISYLIATKEQYVELTGWTMNSQFVSSRDEFRNIFESLIEIDQEQTFKKNEKEETF